MKLRAALREVTAIDLGTNGQFLLTVEPKDWINRFAALQVLSSTPQQDSLHFDGRASLLHMGIAVFGRCRMAFNSNNTGMEHPNCRPVDLVPGNVYIGNLCSVGHQVIHEEANQCFDRAETYNDLNVAVGDGEPKYLPPLCALSE